MNFIEKRVVKSSILFNVGIFLLLLPLFGLITGTAISIGIYGSNYQEFSIIDDADRYWFTIKLELFISFFMVFLSYVKFPIYEHYYGKLLSYRERNKVKFFVLAFVLTPIVITCLIALIMYTRDLFV